MIAITVLVAFLVAIPAEISLVLLRLVIVQGLVFTALLANLIVVASPGLVVLQTAKFAIIAIIARVSRRVQGRFR